MFLTPKEAAMEAELARLRAENEWLRRAVDAPGRTVRPYAVEEDAIATDLPREIRLPIGADIVGRLQEDGRWNVMAHQRHMSADKALRVHYYCEAPSARSHMDDWTYLNDILPRMHERFIRTLAEIYTREHARYSGATTDK